MAPAATCALRPWHPLLQHLLLSKLPTPSPCLCSAAVAIVAHAQHASAGPGHELRLRPHIITLNGSACPSSIMHPPHTGPVLRVARGSSAKPSFEQVQVPLPASPSAAPATITLQPASSGVLLPSTAPSAAAAVAGEAVAAAKAAAKAGKATREDVTVLGPDNMGQPALMRTDGVAAGGKKRGADEVLPAQPQVRLGTAACLHLFASTVSIAGLMKTVIFAVSL